MVEGEARAASPSDPVRKPGRGSTCLTFSQLLPLHAIVVGVRALGPADGMGVAAGISERW